MERISLELRRPHRQENLKHPDVFRTRRYSSVAALSSMRPPLMLYQSELRKLSSFASPAPPPRFHDTRVKQSSSHGPDLCIKAKMSSWSIKLPSGHRLSASKTQCARPKNQSSKTMDLIESAIVLLKPSGCSANAENKSVHRPCPSAPSPLVPRLWCLCVCFFFVV